MSQPPPRRGAIVLLGPTGSGKTPLGNLIERRGLWGARCLHFDFGACLRSIVEQDRPDSWLGREEVDFLRGVLRSGALLEDDRFYVAQRVLQQFVARRGADLQAVIALNGLPRHAGQAEALDAMLRVVAVVFLDCPAETVAARVRGNVGGDRTGREDDDPQSLARRLAVFAGRTAPLIDHYRTQGAAIKTIRVTAEMTADAMWEFLERGGP